MTRRKHPPPKVDADEFGFEVIGSDWCCTSDERIRLLGLDSLARDLYYTCLKPFADSTGKVQQASYYRFLQMLAPVQSRQGGHRLPTPTRKQLRRVLDALRQAGLVTSYPAANLRKGALQIRVLYGVGGPSNDSEGAGVGAGSKRARRPMLVRVQ